MYPYFNGLNNYLETFIENEKLKYNLIYFLLNLNNVIFFSSRRVVVRKSLTTSLIETLKTILIIFSKKKIIRE